MRRDDIGEDGLGSGDLGELLTEIRDGLCVAPSRETASAHLIAMDRAARPPVRQPNRAQRRRRRIAALTAAATVGALAATGGLAAAGSLPAPVQRQAARAADVVGWQIPSRANHSDSDSGHHEQSGITQKARAPQPSGSPTTATTAAAGPTPDSVPAASPRATHGPGTSMSTSVPTPTSVPIQTVVPSEPATTAPGRSGSTPGHAETSPDAPGKSGSTPGRIDSSGGEDGDAPGRSGSAPGHNKTDPGPQSPKQ